MTIDFVILKLTLIQTKVSTSSLFGDARTPIVSGLDVRPHLFMVSPTRLFKWYTFLSTASSSFVLFRFVTSCECELNASFCTIFAHASVVWCLQCCASIFRMCRNFIGRRYMPVASSLEFFWSHQRLGMRTNWQRRRRADAWCREPHRRQVKAQTPYFSAVNVYKYMFDVCTSSLRFQNVKFNQKGRP